MNQAETIVYAHIQSPAGTLLLAAGQRGLRYLRFGGDLPQRRQNELWIESPAKLHPYADELDAYFRGELRRFTSDLDMRGTDFQKKCWQALLAIPYGQTCSYAQLAEQVGSPRGFRAVGQANHHNPIAIIVPCHRVITSDGTLGGYGGGLAIKKMLLDLEKCDLPRSKL